MQTSSLLMLMLTIVLQSSHSAKILGIIPTPSISHQLPFRKIALELLGRGHQVTVATTDPINEKRPNYTEIDLSHSYKHWQSTLDFASMSVFGPIDLMNLMPALAEGICSVQWSSPQIKELLKYRPRFDVIIVERGYGCYHALVHEFGYPPLIGYLSLGAKSPVYAASGNPNNPAYTPDLLAGYSDQMSFWQRLYNTYVQLRMHYVWHYEAMPQQDNVVRRHLGNSPPSIYEVDTNFRLVLVNNHFSMNYPRPLVPGVVHLTGLHMEKKRRPLPKDIKNFLDGAESGVIYFSLGTNVNASSMPEQKLRAFMQAFVQLPQRVLWKWEADDLPGRPGNVMTAKWLPQQDVLAHSGVRLFITQGGLQSMNEAGYFAVPMIVIPFLGDQHHNAAKIVQAGIGYHLAFKDVSNDTILSAIKTVLENPSYRTNVKRFSGVFREHQETSLDRAIWWIEYVIRHKGAEHLRSAAVDLRWWQLLLLDVVAFLVATAAGGLYALYRAAKFITSCVQFRRS